MKKIHQILVVPLILLTFCLSCNNDGGRTSCNDCLDLTTKSLRITDISGTDLVFGDQAIYAPSDISIRVDGDIQLPVFPDETDELLIFALEPDTPDYAVFANDVLIETLSFELGVRESEQCCGNVTFSTKTFVNGIEISNDDLIVIIEE